MTKHFLLCHFCVLYPFPASEGMEGWSKQLPLNFCDNVLLPLLESTHVRDCIGTRSCRCLSPFLPLGMFSPFELTSLIQLDVSAVFLENSQFFLSKLSMTTKRCLILYDSDLSLISDSGYEYSRVRFKCYLLVLRCLIQAKSLILYNFYTYKYINIYRKVTTPKGYEIPNIVHWVLWIKKSQLYVTINDIEFYLVHWEEIERKSQMNVIPIDTRKEITISIIIMKNKSKSEKKDNKGSIKQKEETSIETEEFTPAELFNFSRYFFEEINTNIKNSTRNKMSRGKHQKFFSATSCPSLTYIYFVLLPDKKDTPKTDLNKTLLGQDPPLETFAYFYHGDHPATKFELEHFVKLNVFVRML